MTDLLHGAGHHPLLAREGLAPPGGPGDQALQRLAPHLRRLTDLPGLAHLLQLQPPLLLLGISLLHHFLGLGKHL